MNIFLFLTVALKIKEKIREMRKMWKMYITHEFTYVRFKSGKWNPDLKWKIVCALLLKSNYKSSKKVSVHWKTKVVFLHLAKAEGRILEKKLATWFPKTLFVSCKKLKVTFELVNLCFLTSTYFYFITNKLNPLGTKVDSKLNM